MTDTMERVRSDDAVSTLDRVPALAEARALFLEGSPQDAAVLLRDLARGFPGDAEILNDLGVVCHACGAQQEAEAVLDRAYEISPDDPEIVRNLARVSLSCGMYQRSIDLAARAVQLDGGDALADIVQQAGGKIEQLALYPRFISIETASVCNARCHFCSTPEVKRMAFMKRKTWQKIVDDNREAGVEFRLNMDGEPTLHKELAEIVAYIKSTTNCTATFNTNGERLDAALAESFFF
ncbi:MAG: radical SAM protein, partial [Planctomycetes bacterium]|nr:radical SAM protein [Planctomycetota bacterium]